MGDTLKEHCGNGICCRLGGDEFLLFLKDVSKEKAEDEVRTILSEFEAKKNGDPETTEASLSAGLTMSTPSDSYGLCNISKYAFTNASFVMSNSICSLFVASFDNASHIFS